MSRPFSAEALEAAAREALAGLPAEKRGAIVATATLDGALEFRLMTRVADEWSVTAVVTKVPGTPPEGGVHITVSW